MGRRVLVYRADADPLVDLPVMSIDRSGANFSHHGLLTDEDHLALRAADEGWRVGPYWPSEPPEAWVPDTAEMWAARLVRALEARGFK